MRQMALLFCSSVDSAARWQTRLVQLSSEIEVRIWPEIGDRDEIDYALVWRPEPGLLASLPNLKLILSLGAGVDHILHAGDVGGRSILHELEAVAPVTAVGLTAAAGSARTGCVPSSAGTDVSCR